MDVPCQACSSGPTGFAGHGELNVHTLGDGRMMLRCRPCGSYWSRTLEKEGYFAWAALTEQMAASADLGSPVPRSGHSSERIGLPWRGSEVSGHAGGRR